jgi:hypothetical protein
MGRILKYSTIQNKIYYLKDLEAMKVELRSSIRNGKMTGSQYEELMALDASI